MYIFYIHGFVHCESNLIIFQQDATYSVYYISVGSSTCFGCWHPSSGAGTAVITASGIWWDEYSQKHNYNYMAKWWCLLAMGKNCYC